MQTQINNLVDFQNTLYRRVKEVCGERLALVHKPGQEFIAGNALANLRAALVEEEALELCEALEVENKHQVLKELCDVLYVTLALAAIYRLPLEEAFNRVHANNMEKILNGEIRQDGKLLKPKDHPKVNFKDLLDGELPEASAA